MMIAWAVMAAPAKPIPERQNAGALCLRLLLLGLGLCAAGLKGQVVSGRLTGTVRDSSGARIAGARIAARARHFPLRRQTRSGPRGEFRLDSLPPGAYRLTVSAAGMEAARAMVRIHSGMSRTITVTLRPHTREQSIRVRANPSSITTAPIQLTSTVQEAAITARDLGTIPLAARSFANIAYLAPGTEPVEPSDPTKARITAVSFGGSSGLNDKLTIDGADDSDDYIGGFLENVSPDAIQEFTVQTAQENASVGRTVGGAIEIITRRGGNAWHGNFGVLERAAALNARFPIDNPAPQPKQPFSRQNYYGNLGGPLLRNRLWGFAGLEYVRENASIAYSPANLGQFQALGQLAQDGLIPGVSQIPAPDFVPVPFHDLLGDYRVDWMQSQASQWFFRLTTDSYHTQNALVQQATLASTGVTSRNIYYNAEMHNSWVFSPSWVGSLVLAGSFLRLSETRNSHLGYALAFPFSSTYSTISGFETFGDNQFVTPITAFPVERAQEKYQLRYDLSHDSGDHDWHFGIGIIHEPVLSGALSGTAESLTVFALNPEQYLSQPGQFQTDLHCGAGATPGTTCTRTPASDGSFAQNVQRLGGYIEDSWQVTPRFTVNYGLRYDTTFGLFRASGRSQLSNPAYLTLQALRIPLVNGAPHGYRGALAPRLGLAWAPGRHADTVFHAGAGLLYNDLAQNGWVTALRAVNQSPGPCGAPGQSGCLPGAAAGGSGALIDPGYHTPYAIDISAGFEHAFSPNWSLNVYWQHEEGNHAYRAYTYNAGYDLFSPLYAHTVAAQQAHVPNIMVFRSDNRSRYDGLLAHLQGNVTHRLHLIANYTLSRADTWGCVLGELFDYVNGVCNPLDAFAPGDYGPSGENVTHRLVLAGIWNAPGGVRLSTLTQLESARPFTMTTPVDVNGLGNTTNDRAVVNGTQTTLDEFRGTPYMQVDLRVSRPFLLHDDGLRFYPFVEFFNLLNRNNPGANYVTSLAALPTPVNNLANATALCLNAGCTASEPITSLRQISVPAGALGDFFGPGTTVGIPFAAQLGMKVSW